MTFYPLLQDFFFLNYFWNHGSTKFDFLSLSLYFSTNFLETKKLISFSNNCSVEWRLYHRN